MRASTTELLIVLIVVLVIFGPKQLPRLGKMLGSSLKSFKQGMEEENTTETAAPAEEKSDKDE